MHFNLAVISLFASLAAAAPTKPRVVSRTTKVIPDGPKYTLGPAPPIDCDYEDLNNLKATNDVSMHYDQDEDPEVDSSTCDIHSDKTEFPVVQLENTKFIKKLDCSAKKASVSFTDKGAYDVASKDWSSHSQFVMVTYDPKCGVDFDSSKRDFMMVKSTVLHEQSMTINADIEFVDFFTAFGKETTLTMDIGRYEAPHNLTKRIGGSKSTDFNWNQFPTNSLSDSRFGSGYELFSNEAFTIQCPGCGTSGAMTLTGTVDIGFFSVKKAEITLAGNMKAVAKVGLIANGISQTVPIASVQLAEIPLGALTVPGIFTLGPKVTIDASASVTVEATGDLLAGVELDWPSINAKLDVKEGDATADGFSPNVNPVFDVNGKVSATIEMGLPVSLGVGIDIFNGLLERDLAITDEPGVRVTGTASTDQTCPVELKAGVYNNVDADILGFAKIDIATFTTDLFSTCFGGEEPTATPSVPEGPGPVEPTDISAEPTDVPVTDTPVTDAPITTESPIETGSPSTDVSVPEPIDSNSAPAEQSTVVDSSETSTEVAHDSTSTPSGTGSESSPETTETPSYSVDPTSSVEASTTLAETDKYPNKKPEYPIETPKYSVDPPSSYEAEPTTTPADDTKYPIETPYSADEPAKYSLKSSSTSCTTTNAKANATSTSTGYSATPPAETYVADPPVESYSATPAESYIVTPPAESYVATPPAESYVATPPAEYPTTTSTAPEYVATPPPNYEVSPPAPDPYSVEPLPSEVYEVTSTTTSSAVYEATPAPSYEPVPPADPYAVAPPPADPYAVAPPPADPYAVAPPPADPYAVAPPPAADPYVAAPAPPAEPYVANPYHLNPYVANVY